jgi:hypothetical protein
MSVYLNQIDHSFQGFSGFIRNTMNYTRKQRSAKAMYEGDMWDRGYGYIGPLPVEGDPDTTEIMLRLQRMFTSRNVIEEVVDRAVDGLLSKSPNWNIFDQENLLAKTVQQAQMREQLREKLKTSMIAIDSTFSEQVPTIPEARTQPEVDEEFPDVIEDEEIEAKDLLRLTEAELVLQNAWQLNELGEILKQVQTERMVTGEGKCRVYLGNGFGRKGPVDDILEAVKYVRVEFLENSNSKIIDDDGELLSITKLHDKVKKQVVKGMEVSFVADDGNTYVVAFPNGQVTGAETETENKIAEGKDIPTIVAEMAAKGGDVSSPMFLDGQITVNSMKGKPFVSESMLTNQRALNFDLTLAIGTLYESGYPELITTNAALDYTLSDDPDNPGKKLKTYKTLKRGPKATTNLVGLNSIDQYGTKNYATPGVHFRTPTPITVFDEAENMYYRQVLYEAKQLFVLTTGANVISGESRVQARQDFLKKAQRYKPDLDNFGVWLLTTILHMTAVAAGKTGYFKGLGVLFDSKVYAGELSADEKNVVISMFEKNLISAENAMVLLGIEDPIVESDLIRLDQAEAIQLQVRKMAALSAYSNAIGEAKQNGALVNGRPPGSKTQKNVENNSGLQ